ncbi:MAG: hypothetical protein HY204_07305 [Nitrospirae bacterium]|nr:hypothetical protein [Nitrospirota bacterium]
MCEKIILFFSFTIILPAIIYAETYWGGELPNISNTQLKAQVTLEGGVYTYSYTMSSGSANTGEIGSFDIDIKQPQGGVELSGEGLVNGPGYLKHTSAQVLSEPSTPRMLPIGFFSPPNWVSGPDVFGQAGWGAGDKGILLPGQNLGGFQMTSHGLPSIRDFRVEPELVPPSAGDTGEPPLAPTPEESRAKIKEIEDKVAFKGQTIGPTAPPANFVALDFLTYLIDIKHQAQTLGWIGGPQFVLELDKKLDQVKGKLVAGEMEPAHEKLGSFIEKVEEQYKETKEHEMEKVKELGKGKELEEKKFITSEGYALLKFNAIYLRNQLGPGEKSGEEKEKENKSKK